MKEAVDRTASFMLNASLGKIYNAVAERRIGYA
jgi:hypothetical protein